MVPRNCGGDPTPVTLSVTLNHPDMYAPWNAPRIAVLTFLRGAGQVMFQPHAGTGLLFLVGIGLSSRWALAGAVLGAILGPTVAYLASFDRSEIESGIYGFNSTLVGLAALVFLRPDFLATWVLVVGGCVAATLSTNFASRFFKFPTYTAPFVLTTWAILVIARAVSASAIVIPPGPSMGAGGSFLTDILRGEAEVMLSGNAATGALFLVGIALSNLRHAAIALFGSIVGTAAALYHGDQAVPISIGIYGYNAVLAAMALYLKRPGLTLPMLAALIATLLSELFPGSSGLPALTAPFVVATWAVLAMLWLENPRTART